MKQVKKIEIQYDGAYPNLCSGNLIVIINGKKWEFPQFCLSSNGSVWFDEDWGEHVESGAWEVAKWPKGFLEEDKKDVLNAINNEIPHGCCGGCV